MSEMKKKRTLKKLPRQNEIIDRKKLVFDPFDGETEITTATFDVI